jgi:hypothetical protein
MILTIAIAERERPQNIRRAAGCACYESFTFEALMSGGSPRTFAHLMTGRKPTSRTATAGVFRLPARAQSTISTAMSFSAHNLLFLSVNRQQPN